MQMKNTIVNPVIKDIITFTRTSAETEGKLTEFLITLSPGGGNTLHYHKTYTETFTPLEGELGLKVGKSEIRILKPDETYTVQKYQLHHFFNPGKTEIKFRVQMHPGTEGFEKAIRILYGLAADGLTNQKSVPRSLTHTAILVCMSDMNAPGMLTLFFPLLKLIANIARKRGVEQKLIEKYCL
jgi:mannose-6-phosphate isomerase-like protein (cupin superfamily)